MELKEKLGQIIKIKIDRPMGSKHPEHGFIYPVNYGYVLGVMGGDGEELDAYILGVFEPVEEYEGRLIGIIYREDDAEEKIVVAPRVYTPDQIMALVEFQERWFKSWVACCYDKPYWPEEFSVDMPEVQKALKLTIKQGVYSTATIQTELKKGYGYAYRLGAWLEVNGVVGKQLASKERKLRIKTYKEAVNKLNVKEK